MEHSQSALMHFRVTAQRGTMSDSAVEPEVTNGSSIDAHGIPCNFKQVVHDALNTHLGASWHASNGFQCDTCWELATPESGDHLQQLPLSTWPQLCIWPPCMPCDAGVPSSSGTGPCSRPQSQAPCCILVQVPADVTLSCSCGAQCCPFLVHQNDPSGVVCLQQSQGANPLAANAFQQAASAFHEATVAMVGANHPSAGPYNHTVVEHHLAAGTYNQTAAATHQTDGTDIQAAGSNNRAFMPHARFATSALMSQEVEAGTNQQQECGQQEQQQHQLLMQSSSMAWAGEVFFGLRLAVFSEKHRAMLLDQPLTAKDVQFLQPSDDKCGDGFCVKRMLVLQMSMPIPASPLQPNLLRIYLTAKLHTPPQSTASTTQSTTSIPFTAASATSLVGPLAGWVVASTPYLLLNSHAAQELSDVFASMVEEMASHEDDDVTNMQPSAFWQQAPVAELRGSPVCDLAAADAASPRAFCGDLGQMPLPVYLAGDLTAAWASHFAPLINDWGFCLTLDMENTTDLALACECATAVYALLSLQDAQHCMQALQHACLQAGVMIPTATAQAQVMLEHATQVPQHAGQQEGVPRATVTSQAHQLEHSQSGCNMSNLDTMLKSLSNGSCLGQQIQQGQTAGSSVLSMSSEMDGSERDNDYGTRCVSQKRSQDRYHLGSKADAVSPATTDLPTDGHMTPGGDDAACCRGSAHTTKLGDMTWHMDQRTADTWTKKITDGACARSSSCSSFGSECMELMAVPNDTVLVRKALTGTLFGFELEDEFTVFYSKQLVAYDSFRMIMAALVCVVAVLQHGSTPQHTVFCVCAGVFQALPVLCFWAVLQGQFVQHRNLGVASGITTAALLMPFLVRLGVASLPRSLMEASLFYRPSCMPLFAVVRTLHWQVKFRWQVWLSVMDAVYVAGVAFVAAGYTVHLQHVTIYILPYITASWLTSMAADCYARYQFLQAKAVREQPQQCSTSSIRAGHSQVIPRDLQLHRSACNLVQDTPETQLR